MSVPARQLPPPTVPERAAPIARHPAFWILAAVVVSSLVFTVVALNAVVVDTTYRTTAVQSEVRRLREVNAELRIEVARLCRRFPAILDLLAEGELSLTSVRMVGHRARAAAKPTPAAWIAVTAETRGPGPPSRR